MVGQTVGRTDGRSDERTNGRGAGRTSCLAGPDGAWQPCRAEPDGQLHWAGRPLGRPGGPDDARAARLDGARAPPWCLSAAGAGNYISTQLYFKWSIVGGEKEWNRRGVRVKYEWSESKVRVE